MALDRLREALDADAVGSVGRGIVAGTAPPLIVHVATLGAQLGYEVYLFLGLLYYPALILGGFVAGGVTGSLEAADSGRATKLGALAGAGSAVALALATSLVGVLTTVAGLVLTSSGPSAVALITVALLPVSFLFGALFNVALMIVPAILGGLVGSELLRTADAERDPDEVGWERIDGRESDEGSTDRWSAGSGDRSAERHWGTDAPADPGPNERTPADRDPVREWK